MQTRNTQAKKMILDSLTHSKQAFSQEMVQQALGDQVDRATIYRILNRFCEEGIVHRVVGDDAKQYFACCIHCQGKIHRHHHFHFRCLGCGKVECISPEIHPALPRGYEGVHFNGFISGYCAACHDKGPGTGERTRPS